MIVRSKSLHKAFTTQKGIAAILLVLLTGISATVVTFGVMSHVKSSQRSQMAVHGQTQAELNAWASAEALKQFLDGNTIASAKLTDYSFSFTGGRSFAKATFVDSCSDTENDQYCYQISASSAQNVASLEVVYHITPNQIVVIDDDDRSVVVKGDLDISGGGAEFKAVGGVAVTGNLTLSNAAQSELYGCAVGNINVNGGGVKDDAYLYSSAGNITLTGLNAVNLDVWGGNIDIIGGGGHYSSIKAVDDVNALSASVNTFVSDFTWANNFTIPSGQFNNSLLINNDLVSRYASLSIIDKAQIGNDIIVAANWAKPSFNSASIIQGDVKVGSSTGNIIPVSEITNLTKGGSAPGVPSRPECDVETDSFDIDTLLPMANYIFYIDETTNRRMLKIQNVNNAAGSSIDGTFVLDNYDGVNGTYPGIASGLPKFSCNNNESCFSSPTETYTWNFFDIVSIPKGIIAFGGRGDPDRQVLADAHVNIDGFTADSDSYPLVNTILTSGDLRLGWRSRGNDGSTISRLTAPYFAEASEVCEGSFYPSNLCSDNVSTGVKEFTEVDQNGERWRKVPLANSAVMVENSLTMGSWDIKGHVVVGSSFQSKAGESSVEGVVKIGINEAEGGTANVTQGGLAIDNTNLTEDQMRLYTGATTQTVSGTLGTPSLTWARYR